MNVKPFKNQDNMKTVEKKNKVNTVVDYYTNVLIKDFKSGLQFAGVPMDCIVADIPMKMDFVHKVAHSEDMSKVIFLTALEENLNKRLNKKGVKVIWQLTDSNDYNIKFMPLELFNTLYKVA